LVLDRVECAILGVSEFTSDSSIAIVADTVMFEDGAITNSIS